MGPGVRRLEGGDPELAQDQASAARSLRRRSSELTRWGSPGLRGLGSPRSAARSDSLSRARALHTALSSFVACTDVSRVGVATTHGAA